MLRRKGRIGRFKDGVTEIFGVLVMFGLIAGLPLYCRAKVGQAEDPLFRAARTSCPQPRQVETIEVTPRGISGGCVTPAWWKASYEVVNRLPRQPVTLCVGRRGTCLDGHPSPFPRNRLTVEPGGSVEARFREGRHYGAGYARNYPVTVVHVPGRSLANLDLVVHAPVPPAAG